MYDPSIHLSIFDKLDMLDESPLESSTRNISGSSADPLAKKKVFPGLLELHPSEKALILHYKTKWLSKAPDGSVTCNEKESRDATKIIKVKSLTGDTDIPNLANSLIDQTKFLTPSRTNELITLLYKLQSRTIDPSSSSQPQDDQDNKTWLKKQLDSLKSPSSIIPLATTASSSSFSHLQSPSSAAQNGPVSIDYIDAYIEDLYEETGPKKLESLRCILELSRTPSLQPFLLSNESLMSALSRVLREEHRKSLDLSLLLLSIFYALSSFAAHHALLMQNKVGDMTIRVLEMEGKRWSVLVADLKIAQENSAVHKNDKSIQQAFTAQTIQFNQIVKKQDNLIYVALHLLLNLGEDLGVEVKMVKRGILPLLLDLLSRKGSTHQQQQQNIDAQGPAASGELVHYLCLIFLFKLCVFQENKDMLIALGSGIVDTLLSFQSAPSSSPLSTLSLKLTLNLSHDPGFCATLLSKSYPSLLLSQLSSSSPLSSKHNLLHLQLLYQLTLTHHSHSLSSSNPDPPQWKIDALHYTLKQILDTSKSTAISSQPPSLETISTAINLSCIPALGAYIASSPSLKYLMKRACKTLDPLLFKILRNVAGLDSVDVKYKFLDYIDDLVSLFLKLSQDSVGGGGGGVDDVIVEILGILSSLLIPDFNYHKLVSSFNLLQPISELMSKCLQPSSPSTKTDESLLDVSDDILLQCIILLSTFAEDEEVAPIVVKTVLLDLVVEAMIVKEDDDAILIQTCFCIHQYLKHPVTCHSLIKIPHLVDHLIDLLYDANPIIKSTADASLDLISQIDSEWDLRLKRQKFVWHNSEWIKTITTMESRDGGGRARGDRDGNTTTGDDLTSEVDSSFA